MAIVSGIRTVVFHSQIVADFVSDDVDRLEMSSFVDGAAAGGCAHSSDGRQSDDLIAGVSITADCEEIETGEKQSVIPV